MRVPKLRRKQWREFCHRAAWRLANILIDWFVVTSVAWAVGQVLV